MKFFLTWVFLLIFTTNTITAQTPANVSGYTLWLKAGEMKDSISEKEKQLKHENILYFNFNPVVDNQSFARIFKNIVAEQYSLFFVFKSNFEEERIIMKINRGNKNVIITNKEILSDKEMPFKINSKKGIILGYLNGNNDKNGKKRNSLIIDELFAQDEEGKEQLMELIYFPRLLSKLERQNVETYLSLKYGISIADDVDYLNSKGDKIWDSKENSYYKNRITGIGRDDAYGLYQKQSGNSLKDGIYIGLGKIDTTNTHNKYTLKDKSFLLWGDNGGKTSLSNDKSERLKKMDRIWKIDLSGINPLDSITTQLRINKKEFAYENKSEKDFLWLCINTIDNTAFDYTGAKYIRQSSEDDEFIYFNDIAWDADGSGTDVFTLIQGPDFMMEHNEDFVCGADNGSASVKLIGGMPPYTLNLEGKEITTSTDIVEFNDLQSGTYDLKATESKGNSVSGEIEINPLGDVSVTLLPVWYLNGQQEIKISPIIGNSTENLLFEWESKGKRVSSEKEFIAKAPGDYTLIVSNTEGCKKNIPFRVEGQTENLSSGWKVYPNPVRSGEQFSIAFNLENETETTITINSMEGKQIFYKNLGVIKNYTFHESMIISGVYLVKIHTGNASDTIKLIVR